MYLFFLLFFACLMHVFVLPKLSVKFCLPPTQHAFRASVGRQGTKPLQACCESITETLGVKIMSLINCPQLHFTICIHVEIYKIEKSSRTCHISSGFQKLEVWKCFSIVAFESHILTALLYKSFGSVISYYI